MVSYMQLLGIHKGRILNGLDGDSVSDDWYGLLWNRGISMLLFWLSSNSAHQDAYWLVLAGMCDTK